MSYQPPPDDGWNTSSNTTPQAPSRLQSQFLYGGRGSKAQPPRQPREHSGPPTTQRENRASGFAKRKSQRQRDQSVETVLRCPSANPLAMDGAADPDEQSYRDFKHHQQRSATPGAYPEEWQYDLREDPMTHGGYGGGGKFSLPFGTPGARYGPGTFDAMDVPQNRPQEPSSLPKRVTADQLRQEKPQRPTEPQISASAFQSSSQSRYNTARKGSHSQDSEGSDGQMASNPQAQQHEGTSPDHQRQDFEAHAPKTLSDYLSRETIPHAEIHFYTIQHVDIKSGKSTKAYNNLVHEQIVSQLSCLDDASQIDHSTYIFNEPWQIPASARDGSRPDTNVESVVILTSVDSAEQFKGNGGVVNADAGFKDIVVGLRDDGKLNRQWLKLGNRTCLATDLDGTSGHDARVTEAKLLWASLPTYGHVGSGIGIWFEHRVIKLNDIPALMNSHKDNKTQSLKAGIDAYVGAQLELLLSNAGQTGLLRHGAKVFRSDSFERLSCGVERRDGVQGSLDHDSNKGLPILNGKPVVGRFFTNATVADFLASFYGATLAQEPNDRALQKASSLLRGIKVAVAVPVTSRKQSFDIAGLADSSRTKPECVRGLKAHLKPEDLRYPDLPCVNVGTWDRPFYYPAEMCLILPDQMFHGKLPPLQATDLFKLKETKLTAFKPKNGDPFAQVAPDEFKLFFASIADTTTVGKPGRVLPEVWRQIQQELGMRFNGKLSQAVEKSQKINVEYSGEAEAMLVDIARFTKSAAGVKHVLVLAAPSSIPSDVVNAIRAHCDTRLGVQCCVVSVPELQKRFHPLGSSKTVKYTGQLVRKIFARAMIPGTDDVSHDVTETKPKALEALPAGTGRLFGVHIINLKDLRPNETFRQSPLDLEHHHLVSIVSASTESKAGVHSTLHLLTLASSEHGNEERLNDRLAQCLASHAEGLPLSSATHSAIYLAGLPPATDQSLEKLVKAFDTKLQRIWTSVTPATGTTQDNCLTLISMTPEKVLTIANDRDELQLMAPRDAMGTTTSQSSLGLKQKSEEELSYTLRDDFDLHQRALSHVFRRPDGYRGQDGTVKKSSQLWHVAYERAIPEPKDDTFEKKYTFFTRLERRLFPGILYVAKQASKRARLHIYVKADHAGAPLPECPYGITPLHNELKGSLYYL